MTFTLEVYEADCTTLVDTIDPGQWREASGGDVFSATGAGELQLPRLVEGDTVNPALALIEEGRVIRHLVDSVAIWQMVIEDVDDVLVSSQEEVGEIATITGRGTMGMFDQVRWLPDRGIGRLPFHLVRQLGFAADRLRDDDPDGPQGAWPFGEDQDPEYDTTNYFARPVGYVDTAGGWLAPEDSRTLFAPGGRWYFRGRVELDDDHDAVIIQAAADDQCEVWVDNVPVVRVEGVYQGGAVQASVPMSAGEHLIAGYVDNLNELRTGIVFAGWSVSDGMPDELLFRASPSYVRVLGWPDDPPGFTPTEAIRLGVSEAQERDMLLDLDLTYISASDSYSQEVDEVTDLSVNAPADSLLTTLEMLGETYLDHWMSPSGFEHNAVIRGTRGTDLSGTVSFAKGSCREVRSTSVGSEKWTVALVIADGQTSEVVHADEATVGRREISLDFGEASMPTARLWAGRYLDTVSQARRGMTVQLVPGAGPVPFEDFEVGDIIDVMGEDHRVAAIGWTVDADSIIRWNIDLDNPKMQLEERLGAIMRRFLPGGAGGRTILPTPTTPSFPSQEACRETSEEWQWNGAPGTVQLIVDGVSVTGASVTVGTDGSGRVTVIDAARRYTRKSSTIRVSVDSNLLPVWTPPEGRWVQEMTVTDTDGDTSVITVKVA